MVVVAVLSVPSWVRVGVEWGRPRSAVCRGREFLQQAVQRGLVDGPSKAVLPSSWRVSVMPSNQVVPSGGEMSLDADVVALRWVRPPGDVSLMRRAGLRGDHTYEPTW